MCLSYHYAATSKRIQEEKAITICLNVMFEFPGTMETMMGWFTRHIRKSYGVLIFPLYGL